MSEGGAFDAGSILGHLGMEIGEYEHGMLGAEALNEIFPENVTAFLANPLLGFMETAKEVFESVKDFVEDAVSEVAKSGFEIAIAAERMGASAEFLKKWETVGDSVGVPLETLTNAMRGLQKSASDAVEQGGTYLKYWNQIGISTEQLKGSMGNMPALFDMVREHISDLPTQAERTAAAMHLMRGAGSELNPIFAMSAEKIDELVKSATDMGDTFTEQDATVAKNVHELGDAFDHAWAGIQQATAKPILQFLSDHMTEIMPLIKEGAKTIETDIGNVMGYLETHGPQVIDFLKQATQFTEGLVDLIGDVIDGVQWILDKAGDLENFVKSIPGGTTLVNAMNPFYVPGPTHSGGDTNVNLNISTKDSDERTAAKVAAETKKALLGHQKQQRQRIDAMIHNGRIASVIGGNP